MNLVKKLISADQESPKRILIIGDCMFDTYVIGRLEPTCQEGCPKFIEESNVTVPGGAANAARSLENWPSYQMYLSVNGGHGVVCIPGKSPGLPDKFRFMDNDRCVFRYDNDKCGMDLKIVRQEALRILRTWKPHAILLCDYDKGVIDREVVNDCVVYGSLLNVPCVVDAKREPFLYRGTIIKGNAEWYNKYCTQGKGFVITNGSFSPHVNGEAIISDLPRVPCINHVGAGDCFAAHMTLALAHGFSLKESAIIAYSAGRVYVQKRYNEPPRLQEIATDVREV